MDTAIYGGDYVGADFARWVCVYPVYCDSTLGMSGGRKVSKEKCVSKPTAVELFEAAKAAGFRTVLETDKAYCRDYWVRGRVRVALFSADGAPVSPEVPNRRALYAALAAKVPKLREKAKSKANQASGSSSKQSGKRKKKGKR